MKITVKKIESYNPCKSGIDDFKSKHPKFNDKLTVLLSLDDISYNDKVWLACKVVDIKTLQQWGVECAEMVLQYFEEVIPSDRRVRDCLEISKRVLLGELPKGAAWTAADAAADAAAWAAAWAADAVVWAADAEVWTAAWAADAAWEAKSEQESLNLSILIALLENQGM